MPNDDNSKPKPLPGGIEFLLPVLNALADGAEHHRSDICKLVAKNERFSEEQVKQRLPSGYLALPKRVDFAMSHLQIAGLVERPQRGFCSITKDGERFLRKARDEDLEQITYKLLRERCPKYASWRKEQRKIRADRAVLDSGDNGDLDELLSLEEQLENVYGQLRSVAERKILTQLREVSPSSSESLSFERIVMDLLQKMGYGQGNLDWGEVTGGPGDGGIDGVIKEDALGLRKTYMQAKRQESNISVKDLRQFVGALVGMGATKGVFVTTSDFTKKAQEYVAGQTQYNIILIDGKEFVRLMLEYRIGVVCREIYLMEKIDENYFDK